jgi:hypothetical protein
MTDDFADDIINKIFGDGNKQPVREALVRSEGFGYAYDDWKLTGHATLAYQALREQMVMNLSGNDLECIRFVDGQSNGFYVRAGSWMNTPDELEFLLDDIATKLKQWHYLEQMNERVSAIRNEVVEVYHRRYLKPSFKKPAGLMNYGNIMLETSLKNGKVSGFKLTATTYPGQPEGAFSTFENLLDRLLKD